MADFSFGRDNPLDPRFAEQKNQTQPLTEEGFGTPGPAPAQATIQPMESLKAEIAPRPHSLEPAIAPTFETPQDQPASPSQEPRSFKTLISTKMAPISTPAIAQSGFFSSRVAHSEHPSDLPRVENESISTPTYSAPPIAEQAAVLPQQQEAVQEHLPAIPPQQKGLSALVQAKNALSHEGILQARGDVLIDAVVLQTTIEQAISGDTKALSQLKEGGLDAIKAISAHVQGSALEELTSATKALVYEGYISLASKSPAKVHTESVDTPQTSHAERISARVPSTSVPAL